jgi:hypothetical protein
MVQAVSSLPFTLEAWLSPCWIFSEQSSTGTGFSLSSSVSPCEYHSTVALHAHICCLSGVVVSVLATEPKGGGFKPG